MTTKFEAWTYADAISVEMPRGYTSSEEILDVAYGVSKRIFGEDTTRLLFCYEDGFENLMVEYYFAADNSIDYRVPVQDLVA